MRAVRSCLLLVLCWIVASGIAVLPARAVAADPGYMPGQFVAKLYTEALGRMPDQKSWLDLTAWFAANGCRAVTLDHAARDIYDSTEFTNLDYDNAAKTLTLYRGVLNREPDKAGFDSLRKKLDAGTPWSVAVDGALASPEFAELVPKICSGATDSADTSYGLGSTPPLAIPTTTKGFTGTEAELQLQLDKTKTGDAVTLAGGALVTLTLPLTIPDGVTLTTAGSPDNAHYANMGRLVRAVPFDREMVTLRSGATLRNVWIDGERDTPGNWAAPRANLRLNGGTGTTAAENKISNTAGPSSVFVLGDFDGYPCKQLAVTDNVITAYSSNNYDSNTWTDGISVTCGDTDVAGNQIVDTTDVAIVLYRSSGPRAPNAVQASQVHDNQVLSAGNSMYGAIVADPLFVPAGDPTATHDFTGSAITGNTVWTGPDTHFDIGLVAGTRAWFGRDTNTGIGASITGNTTGPATARVEMGIAVAGMQHAKVSGNTTHWVHSAGIGRCPSADLAVDDTTATGDFAPKPDRTVGFDGCIGHHSAAVTDSEGGYQR
ncbi:MAG TPA: DUF4214 domain-containing protein [Mycobacteriales bacterium]|nr:DUF4214 domain-containing protein [Mycobacteriales bacterium]